MKILITGISGFIGKHVASELMLRGNEVAGVVRTKNKVFEPRYQLIVCRDLFKSSQTKLKKIIENFDVVIHCAWYVKHNDYLFSSKNIEATIGSIKLAQAAKASDVKHFIGIGSCFEYDLTGRMPITVKSPLRPNTVYGHSKVSLYHSLTAIFKDSGTKFSWARLFYIYGDGEPETKLYSYIKKQIDSKKKIKLGPCEVHRDYLHVLQASKQIADIVLNPDIEIVNICSGFPIKLKEFATDIAKTFNGQDLLEFSNKVSERPSNEIPVIYGER